MKRRKLLTIAVIAALALGLSSAVAVAQLGRGAGMGMDRPAQCMRAGGPVFTDEQKNEIAEVHEKYDEEKVELANRARVLRLEMAELLGADDIDFGDVENKIEEIHAVKLELAKLRLRIHQEVRPLLTDDQRALFDRGFGRMGGRMMGGGHGMGAGCGRGGMRGGHGMGMRGGRGMHPRGGMGGMGCPFGGGMGQPDDMEDDD